jgi:hypothetical protein
MHRLLVCATLTCAVLAAAACGSDSTSPKDTFSGTWNGATYLPGSSSANDTIYVEDLVVTQTGSAFTGTGTGASNGTTAGIAVHGTVALPNVSGWLVIPAETDSVPFTGAFVNADSISGTIVSGDETLAFGLKKS